MLVDISCYVTMSKISKNLAAIMASRQVNQPELARLSGVDQSLISRYLRQDSSAKTPSIKNLTALASALKVSILELVGLEDITPSQAACHPASPSNEQIALWDAYSKLPDGHWLKIMIKQELLDSAD